MNRSPLLVLTSLLVVPGCVDHPGPTAVEAPDLSGSAIVATSAVVNEAAKLLAGDGAAGDQFGVSVAISGDVAVVGAQEDDDNGVFSGSAYVFRRSGSTWVQEAKLLAAEGARGDRFGSSVAISGDVAVVGAQGNDDNGYFSGSAYVFRRSGSAWVQEAKLLAADAARSAVFGLSVAISGDVAVVGAWGDDDNGAQSGAAYVFRWSGSAWVQEVKLLPADGAHVDCFGYSVAISGDAAAVGAYRDDDNGDTSGSAYVFRRSGSAWVEEAKLLPADGGAEDQFGFSVAISGDVAVVGAQWDDDNGHFSGSAYAFRRSGSAWVEEAKLLPADGAAEDRFGGSVAISGDVALVGAWGDDDRAGSAYAFELAPQVRGCFIEAGSFSDRLTTTTGETFWGEAANDPELGQSGFVDADWAHDAEGFSMTSFDRAFDVTCFVGPGGSVGIIDGEAVVNDELGYTYTVEVLDDPFGADDYTINVCQEGALVYSFSGEVAEGDDIVITIR